MAFYQLAFHQKIPATQDEVWDFISSPRNLKAITPEHMNFEIISPKNDVNMYPGMIITYRVSPLPGIRIKWVTEITQVIEKRYFVDEQRVGPYRIWHHQHHLQALEGGVKMSDMIFYQPPLGILGTLANAWFIDKQLSRIFAYRYRAIEKKFGAMKLS